MGGEAQGLSPNFSLTEKTGISSPVPRLAAMGNGEFPGIYGPNLIFLNMLF